MLQELAFLFCLFSIQLWLLKRTRKHFLSHISSRRRQPPNLFATTLRKKILPSGFTRWGEVLLLRY
jgi:hypothetical protein